MLHAIRPLACVGWICLVIAGCESETPRSNYYSSIKFHDDADSNTDLENAWEGSLSEFAFVDANGKQVPLSNYLGKQSLVVVVTRGYLGSSSYGGEFCLYCSTQTSRLIANYDEFKKRDAEVVVVFPVTNETESPEVARFIESVQGIDPTVSDEVPFPVLLDVELKAVDKLGIRHELARPATYIFDPQGRVQFAYVGNTVSDRPSLQAILAQLDKLSSSPAPPDPASEDNRSSE